MNSDCIIWQKYFVNFRRIQILRHFPLKNVWELWLIRSGQFARVINCHVSVSRLAMFFPMHVSKISGTGSCSTENDHIICLLDKLYMLTTLLSSPYPNDAQNHKSNLSYAIGIVANHNSYMMKYIRHPDLFSELAVVRAEGKYKQVIREFQSIRLIILDEWLLFPLTATEARDVLEIVEGKYACRLKYGLLENLIFIF